ncbi:MAG: polysaccharide deacetylase family protein [Candidatus Omnitrophica bacterium]|jgi:peptidoglycan/xylan/chitin deacetylase (PgdA/CDA1 family)|nr:polysaccharide deacetylase family protein [Candidatus Omnitrophota bacterium]
MPRGAIARTIYKALYNTLRYSFEVKKGVVLDIPILMYHQIGLKQHSEYPSIYTSKDSFEKQMRILKESGYETIYLSEYAQILKRPGSSIKKRIVICFDDAYEGVYKFAYPVLAKYNFKAVVFIITEKLKKKLIPRSFPFLSINQIKELQKHNFKVASHSYSHADLTKVNNIALEREIGESKRILEDIFSAKVESFSYPMNKYNAQVIEMVKKHGYTCACTDNLGLYNFKEDLFTLKRIAMLNTISKLKILYRLRIVGKTV